MPLSYYPRLGEVLVCHYGHQAIHPEIGKSRPCVVIGPRLRNRGGLVGVVPLSTTAPPEMCDYHRIIEFNPTMPAPYNSPVMWAKCDLFSNVSLERLDRFKLPAKRYGGPRTFTTGQLGEDVVAELKRAVLCGLGLGSLTIHI